MLIIRAHPAAHGSTTLTNRSGSGFREFTACAMIEKDQTAMERYFDEKLTFPRMSGKKQTREEFIGEIMDGTLNYFKVDTAESG